MIKLEQLRFELVAHPPYSPDLAPSDCYLFPNLKRSRERNLHRMRKSSRKPRRISKIWTFRTTERTSKCWKIAVSSVSLSKATMLRNKYNFVQKTLVFIKNRDFSAHVVCCNNLNGLNVSAHIWAIFSRNDV